MSFVLFITCPEDFYNYVLQNFENLQDTLSCKSFYFANSWTATDDPSPFLAPQKLHDFLQVALDDNDCCACQANCVPTKIERPSKLAWGSCISCKIFAQTLPTKARTIVMTKALWHYLYIECVLSLTRTWPRGQKNFLANDMVDRLNCVIKYLSPTSVCITELPR